MAVYTPVSHLQAAAFFAGYPLGDLLAITPIQQGIENSNFFVDTTQARYILTLFEQRTRAEDLPYFIDTMRYFAATDMPIPQPMADHRGTLLQELCGRPALVSSFLSGKDVGLGDITPAHCRSLGAMLARLHQHGQKHPLKRENQLGLDGWKMLAKRLGRDADKIWQGLSDMLVREVAFLMEHYPANLCQATIHADLFCDNILWQGDQISGIIDWYFACRDSCLYDLAISFNAWCFDAEHRYCPERGEALLKAYREHSPIDDTEWGYFSIVARGAAVRFLLTRSWDWLNTPTGAMVVRKDPREYWLKWRFHSEAATDKASSRLNLPS